MFFLFERSVFLVDLWALWVTYIRVAPLQNEVDPKNFEFHSTKNAMMRPCIHKVLPNENGI